MGFCFDACLTELDKILFTQGLSLVFISVSALNLLLIISMETGKAPHVAKGTKSLYIYIIFSLQSKGLFFCNAENVGVCVRIPCGPILLGMLSFS